MYIAKIKITNFRNFKENEIIFNDGVNVIIGHNNAGKSNLLKALALVIDCQTSKRLAIDDFNKNITVTDLKNSPPKVRIELTIHQSIDEDLTSDDLVTVGNWLTKITPPYEALLTYEFFLPEKKQSDYAKALATLDDKDIKKAWKIIEHDFIRFYTHKIFGGNIVSQTTADSESLQKFDFQFLDAIRDVERDMFTGRNTLLKDVLDFFIDYEIKNGTDPEEHRNEAIKTRKEAFSLESDKLLESLQQRMESGKQEILCYAKATGASFNQAIPDFEGSISEIEMFSALRLIVQYETGITIPATHNGLGYNNLIFMSLLLAKMQVNSDGNYLGSNAKVFPMLAIEEPEAHLHPAMQYKFLKFLNINKERGKVRQIFITTHSTQITSAVQLNEIICLHSEGTELTVGYPGKVFSDDEQGEKSKAYVQRFLDATKSDMLFARKVILVEGIAEQLLVSIMAKYMDRSLEDEHIAVINVGGRYFDHFLNLFSKLNPNSIPKKVACLTDIDPLQNELSSKSKPKKCYPFEYNQDSTTYNYSNNSQKWNPFNNDNIQFFSQDEVKGKTFEYDLVLHNPSLDLLITDSTKNRSEFEKLMELYVDNKPLSEFDTVLRGSDENQRILDGIKSITWSDDDKKRAIIAARYLNSVGKGENALELAYVLENNLAKKKPEVFVVPTYIKEAIDWICQ